MGIFSFFIKSSITSSHMPFTLIEMLSKGVSYKFTTTSYFFSPTILGISAAGVTVRLLPKTKHISDYQECVKPFSISFSGKFSPKLIIESFNSPLHFQLSHFLPVKWSCTFLAVLVLKSRIYFLPHFLHISILVFPCNSANFSGGKPDLLCKPSMF